LYFLYFIVFAPT